MNLRLFFFLFIFSIFHHIRSILVNERSLDRVNKFKFKFKTILRESTMGDRNVTISLVIILIQFLVQYVNGGCQRGFILGERLRVIMCDCVQYRN